jgi:hypothetical protein
MDNAVGLNVVEGFKSRLFYFILLVKYKSYVFFYHASRYNRVKKNQLDAQLPNQQRQQTVI